MPTNDHAAALKAAQQHNAHPTSLDMSSGNGCGCPECISISRLILSQRHQAVAEDRAKVNGDAMEAATTWMLLEKAGYDTAEERRSLAALLTRYAEQAISAATQQVEILKQNLALGQANEKRLYDEIAQLKAATSEIECRAEEACSCLISIARLIMQYNQKPNAMLPQDIEQLCRGLKP